MERITLALDILNRALLTLEEQIGRQKIPGDAPETRERRDSLIQRFEFSSDATFKLIKACLTKIGHPITAKGNGTAARFANEADLISKDELEALYDLIADRNDTVHEYDEERTIEIADRIPSHYELMKTIAKRIQQHPDIQTRK